MNNQKMPFEISSNQLVTVTQAGEQTKVTYIKHRNTKARIVKVGKNGYIIVSEGDGTVHECKHTDNRMESPKSVRKSLNQLCDVINANVADIKRCKWVTLTYAEYMTDLKKLIRDWENFAKKVRRKWGSFEYIKVKEPQGRGAWHLHVLMIFESKAPYMDKGELCKAWGNRGFVYVKNLKDGFDNGLYFMAHIGDMELSEAEAAGITVDSNKLSADKKYIKGARLSLYPRGVRIFDCSQGIARPIKQSMTKAQADLLVQDKSEVSQYNAVLTDDDGHYVNEISVTKYRDKKV